MHRHRCTGLTYLPNVGEKGCLGSKVVLRDTYKEATWHLPDLGLLSLNLEGRQEGMFSSGFG